MSMTVACGLFGASLIAGFIDSVAGGGGLITLPALFLVLGSGPLAIGTNKIAAAVGAATALIVYARKGHFQFKQSFAFAGWVAMGSLLGSVLSPLLPSSFFRGLLLVACPVILWLAWKRDLWVEAAATLGRRPIPPHSWRFILSGIACGLYDGVLGPGGGTFMSLALLFVVQLPLLPALAGSRFVNLGSAVVALSSYSLSGHVQPALGVPMAAGIALGASVGAMLATRKAARIVRPLLMIIALLLAWRVAW